MVCCQARIPAFGVFILIKNLTWLQEYSLVLRRKSAGKYWFTLEIYLDLIQSFSHTTPIRQITLFLKKLSSVFFFWHIFQNVLVFFPTFRHLFMKTSTNPASFTNVNRITRTYTWPWRRWRSTLKDSKEWTQLGGLWVSFFRGLGRALVPHLGR